MKIEAETILHPHCFTSEPILSKGVDSVIKKNLAESTVKQITDMICNTDFITVRSQFNNGDETGESGVRYKAIFLLLNEKEAEYYIKTIKRK